jgi:hypothetical protein
MEEVANLLWVGYILAENGPPGFQTLWSLLAPPARHYVYGMNDSAAACEAAADQLHEYAVELEHMIINRTVRF